jgi:hypothetical protein
MIPRSARPVDSRSVETLLEQFLERRPGYVPTWNPEPKSAGAAVGPIFARLLSSILERLNQVPAKDKLAMLDYFGLRLVPAQPSRAPIVFQLSKGAPDSAAPEGTRIAAPPPPGSTQQIVFETEQDAGIASAKLAQVVSLWPGRDQYSDHSAALAAGTPFTLYDPLQLQQTDHILYLGHQSLLSFAGSVHLLVTFDLLQGSSSPLDLAWEYWDGTVWRGFIENPASCLNSVGAGIGADGTKGLSRAGAVHLDVGGAQTAATTVNGVSNYWIRARVSQPLPPDPGVQLPIVNAINLRTKIDRRMEAGVSVKFDALVSNDTSLLTLVDECGQELNVTANVVIANADDSTVMPATVPITSGMGSTSDISFSPGQTYQFTISFLGLSGTAFVPFQLESAAAGSSASIVIAVKVEGLLPDKAMCDGKTLDLTKAFNPLGASPRPGSALYFKQNEVFGKAGAQVQIYLDPAQVPSLSGPNVATPTYFGHTVNWEYWNGWEWSLLVQSTGNVSTTTASDNAKEFTAHEIVKFIVPQDFRSTTVSNEPGLWMRARLVSGGYGYQQSIPLPNPPGQTINYVQPQPPSIAVLRMGYSWVQGPAAFENVFSYNDFQYEDNTDAARLPGSSFSPCAPISETTAALYLGFDNKLPINNFGVYADIVEQTGASEGPALVWEYFNGAGWQSAAMEDGTQNLQLPGVLNFIPAADNTSLARFGNSLYWFRGRLKEDEDPVPSVINNLYTNAVWASQRETFNNSALGASNGSPNQMFQFSQIPILPGQIIEVQELSGSRANTEWRLTVLDVTSGDSEAVSELEGMLSAEGSQTDLVLDSIRLTRDKTKKVIAVWVQWKEQQKFFDSDANARDYVLDHASGRLFFGDGDLGKIPPAGAAIQASTLRSGGGLAGNLKASTITQLLGSVSGIQSVSNPRSAEGGADGETPEEFSMRGPMTIRNRGRAVTLSDYETMAREASAGVAVARAIPTCDPAGRTVPGWVTLVIIPQSQEARPIPSFGLREDVRFYLEQRAAANLALAHSIEVIGPEYLPVDVTATLAPVDPALAGDVEQAALKALANFLHPLYGGPGGLGWDSGRGVFVSDVAAVLGEAAGVDYVEDLKLYVNGVLQADLVEVPAGKIVVAGQLQVSLILPVGG